jgi:hypothetical protein
MLVHSRHVYTRCVYTDTTGVAWTARDPQLQHATVMQQSVCQLLCDELRLSDTLYDSSSAYTATKRRAFKISRICSGSNLCPWHSCTADTNAQKQMCARAQALIAYANSTMSVSKKASEHIPYSLCPISNVIVCIAAHRHRTISKTNTLYM